MKKVLVVDDSKTIRTICEWIYKSLEDRVLTADSAASARAMIESESPDIVVVDYTLPDMDAYDFVASISNQVRVVMMGGTYAEFDANLALAKGAVSTIMKPFRTADFFAKMDEAMTLELGAAPAVSMPEPEVIEPQVVEAEPELEVPAMPETPEVASLSSEVPSINAAASSPAVPSVGSSSTLSSVSPASSPVGISSMAPAVSPFGASRPGSISPMGGSGSSVAPIFAHTAHGSDGVPPISSHAAPLGGKSASGIQPAAPRRFNFPGSNSTITEAPKVADGGTPPAKVDSVVAPMPTASTSSEVAAVSRPLDRSTPKTPVPSISPLAQQANVTAPAAAPAEAPVAAPAAETQNVQIDPAVLRAEVIAAVKQLLPGIVNSYLKKLIQAEVKPQLQNWVDARVEALVKKMMQ